MKFTYDDILKELNLNRYNEITLDDLDERIIKVINEDTETNLGLGYEAIEVLKDKYYSYWHNDNDEYINRVYFEVIELNNNDPVYSIIKII